ncbi:MAG: class I SAM-dependent methyltransferase [Richelia sp. RM2_1_2]|nr:class I SAM-dependent methyltransferase [Richelia sp. SM1_7_0]NJN10707.1 class I SAM-dependent methyltransferase [Richelia sp. RM1_1_1]NJO31016.1 class I SAM-dependent methyltransferase [Richelia sp. SL_2_1]NJO57955.1 class I SAM-dependent methyltransferase [Richelia sp. RM2_1_2]
MGFYSQKIFPYLLDWSLSSPLFSKYRQEVLAEVEGEVLEIGFGTGLNLSYYPEEIQKIITIDNNPGVHKLAQKRIEKSRITVDNRILSGENLPMADNTFDSVVSTLTLCSIEKVEQAVKEIYRVLKPGGKFFFIEHGLSNETDIQTWQNRLTPIQKIIGDGCHLNRNIRSIVEQQFQQVNLEEFYLEKTPKVAGYMYKGVAIKEVKG